MGGASDIAPASMSSALPSPPGCPLVMDQEPHTPLLPLSCFCQVYDHSDEKSHCGMVLGIHIVELRSQGTCTRWYSIAFPVKGPWVMSLHARLKGGMPSSQSQQSMLTVDSPETDF